jgi:hypothetical protein
MIDADSRSEVGTKKISTLTKNLHLKNVKKGRRTSQSLLTRPCCLPRGCHEEGQYHANQRSTLYEGRCEDHVCADVTCCLWLAGDTFYCFATDLADSETCADNCEACTNCCVHN